MKPLLILIVSCFALAILTVSLVQIPTDLTSPVVPFLIWGVIASYILTRPRESN